MLTAGARTPLRPIKMSFALLFSKNKKEGKEISSGEHQESEGEKGKEEGKGLNGLESRQGGDPPSVYPRLDHHQIIICKSNNGVILILSATNLPYLLPGGPPGAGVLKHDIVGSFGEPGGGGAGQVGDSKLLRQDSIKHPLDGVHFSLSPRYVMLKTWHS